jgi:hypothetical protein
MTNQTNTSRHPSGLTWERWEWPFKTPQERQLVAKYFDRVKKAAVKEEKQKMLNDLGEALL